jgi:hypothetical protein
MYYCDLLYGRKFESKKGSLIWFQTKWSIFLLNFNVYILKVLNRSIGFLPVNQLSYLNENKPLFISLFFWMLLWSPYQPFFSTIYIIAITILSFFKFTLTYKSFIKRNVRFSDFGLKFVQFPLLNIKRQSGNNLVDMWQLLSRKFWFANCRCFSEY